MTMMITILEKDHVHMVTDGAGLMPDGTMGGRLVKAFPMPHLNMVVGCRGVGASSIAIGVSLCGAGGTYDEVKANASRILRELHSYPVFSANAEVFVCGFTNDGKPDAWMLANHGAIPDIAPYEVVDLGKVTVFPAPFLNRPGLMKDLHGPRPLDHLAELVADVRETPAPIGMGKGVAGLPATVEGYTVGAFVQIVTVERDRITTACLHRWPEDEIGRPIAPGQRQPFAA